MHGGRPAEGAIITWFLLCLSARDHDGEAGAVSPYNSHDLLLKMTVITSEIGSIIVKSTRDTICTCLEIYKSSKS